MTDTTTTTLAPGPMYSPLPGREQLHAQLTADERNDRGRLHHARAHLRAELIAEIAPEIKAEAARTAQEISQQAQARLLQAQAAAAAGGDVATLARERMTLIAEAQVSAEQALAADERAAHAHQQFEAAIRLAWRARIDQAARRLSDAQTAARERVETALQRLHEAQQLSEREIAAANQEYAALVRAEPTAGP